MRARVCVLSSALPHTNKYLLCVQRECEVKTRGGKKMIFAEKFTLLVLSNRQFDLRQAKELRMIFGRSRVA